MINRITKNEERLDNILISINELERAINKFKKQKNNIRLLNNYYGSKNWFKDKETYESNQIEHIKAGVLSEDAVWNMNEDINYLLEKMQEIINMYKKED